MHQAESATLCCDATIASSALGTSQRSTDAGYRRDSLAAAGDRQPDDARRLLDAIRQSLRSSPYRELQRLEISMRDRIVVLTGSVRSFYLKQVAQTAVLRVPGVGRIRNDLQVAG
jgi:osmotically-inducible protein OsmY